ncbi:MAG: penicillin acylase family protein [Acidobacteria bacterium]|nr:penicillin acylase family protein [Acidobacteriota bacterium]
MMAAGAAQAAGPEAAEAARWKARAAAVTIVRDDWGIAHVSGKSDADAVFGAIYAQAEDDFFRVETNYLTALGRMAEAEGEGRIWQDLRARMFLDSGEIQKHYAASPVWLRTLMTAWADGLNYFLSKHPEVRPRVLRRFEPWMALSFTEGSIGGDLERVGLDGLRAFYQGGGQSGAEVAATERWAFPAEPTGSNGIAIAPSNTTGKKALLLINPHTTFFFRAELQMTSEEGLNAYGAATWGQFFVYQGFNDRVGWMHTSSNVDAVDEFVERVERGERGWTYRYGAETRPVEERKVTIGYRMPEGGLGQRTFTTYRTHHGPVVRRESEGRWVAVGLMVRPVEALEESYLRTKARNYKEYLRAMELRANSSNNTVYADADGNVAYFHGNFLPRRNAAFDYTKPVEGWNPAAEWKGLHAVEELPNLLNPASGWLYNTNNWPWSAAGESSPKQAAYPAYVEQGRENARGLHAIRVLEKRRDFTLETLLAAAYDSYLPWFEQPVKELVAAWEALPETDARKEGLRAQVAALRGWDLRWGVDSVPTSLAMYWATQLRPGRGLPGGRPANELLGTLEAATQKLTEDFGSWRTEWGQINRFQRLTGEIQQKFDDGQPSVAVGFASGMVGSLASFAARQWPGTKRWYGTSGNSFVAVVEFGKERVRARAVSAGGESGHPGSKHFNDQAERYAAGALREVYFYREQLKGHTEAEYHP